VFPVKYEPGVYVPEDGIPYRQTLNKVTQRQFLEDRAEMAIRNKKEGRRRILANDEKMEFKHFEVS
jgi:hypothetical protein